MTKVIMKFTIFLISFFLLALSASPVIAYSSNQTPSNSLADPSTSQNAKTISGLTSTAFHQVQNYASCPCPMGLTDYGVYQPVNGNRQYYTYYSGTVRGTATINSLKLGLSNANQYDMDVQFNAIATNVLEGSNSNGWVWWQNVAYIGQSGSYPYHAINIFDNIWNFSASYFALVSPGAVQETCSGSLSHAGYCFGLFNFPWSYGFPLKIVLQGNWFTGSGSAPECVAQSYQLWHGTVLEKSATYDTVCFDSSGGAKLSPSFVVGLPNPRWARSTLEFVLTGGLGGEQSTIDEISAVMRLGYVPAPNYNCPTCAVKLIPHAWSEALTTAETVVGVQMSRYSSTTHIGKASSGTDTIIQLW